MRQSENPVFEYGEVKKKESRLIYRVAGSWGK